MSTTTPSPALPYLYFDLGGGRGSTGLGGSEGVIFRTMPVAISESIAKAAHAIRIPPAISNITTSDLQDYHP